MIIICCSISSKHQRGRTEKNQSKMFICDEKKNYCADKSTELFQTLRNVLKNVIKFTKKNVINNINFDF